MTPPRTRIKLAMASILRSIIAGPRAKHTESNLDLCYVTPFLIATSGPSSTYPQRAYRNPLDQLVKYLDKAHGDNWCIWEFRAEGTGYPDSEVYGRVRHYPWPDHHPPPFGVVPLVMGSMRQWLGEGDDSHDVRGREGKVATEPEKNGMDKRGTNGRVVIVHCKAGKGRSGTMACSYLISECGWKMEEALARFTERRMRPGFGQGVSIPSQLRWVGYVDRWTKGGKIYVERQVEIMEVHVWGLRDGVKVAIEGYVDEGKVIKTFHVFGKDERLVVEGTAPGGAGFSDLVADMAGYGSQNQNTPQTVANEANSSHVPSESKIEDARANATPPRSKTLSTANNEEVGGGAVMFKPRQPLLVPSSDICIDFERRNKAGYGLAMVTSVAHVWFNTFFEGNGPEQHGTADGNGTFEIEWDKMDGIKGSLRKGTRAFDRLAVVWKAHNPPQGTKGAAKIIKEPGINSPVEDMTPANWKGESKDSGLRHKDLGLRTESPASKSVSKASSVKSASNKSDTDDDSFKGLRPSSIKGDSPAESEAQAAREADLVDVESLPQPQAGQHVPDLGEVNKGLDTASSTTAQRGL